MWTVDKWWLIVNSRWEMVWSRQNVMRLLTNKHGYWFRNQAWSHSICAVSIAILCMPPLSVRWVYAWLHCIYIYIYIFIMWTALCDKTRPHPDSKVYEDSTGPTWGRQDPGGPHVAPLNLVIWATCSWTKDQCTFCCRGVKHFSSKAKRLTLPCLPDKKTC